MSTLMFEDIFPGQRFVSGGQGVTAEDIVGYARQFDPQPFHLDDTAARGTLFGGLAASGWHTGSITMRLIVEAIPIAGGIIGAGLDLLKWPHPVRPGDTLHVEAEVLETRTSKSRPEQGWVKMRVTTLNQDSAAVMVIEPNLIVPRRQGDTA